MRTSSKFSEPEVAALRSNLLEGSYDVRDAAELLQLFLIGRGYGVSPEEARAAVSRVGGSGCSVEAIQRELNRIALVQ